MDPTLSQTIYPAFPWAWLVAVVVMLIGGVLLLGVEILVLPGFGVGGVLGILSLLGGTGCAWIFLGPTWGALVVVATVAFATGLFILATRSGIIKKRLVLDTAHPHGGGTGSETLRELIGVAGEAATDLRPAGKAALANRRIDVVSDGGFIEKGAAIKVVAIDGPRVVVARVDRQQ